MESRCGRDFSHLSRLALGLAQPPVQRVPGIFPGRKAARGVDSPPPSSAEVKEIAALYLCSPSWPSWPVRG
jgi:hypothetical protein